MTPMNSDDALNNFIDALEREPKPQPVRLTADQLDTIQTALMIAEDAIRSMRDGKMTDYLATRISEKPTEDDPDGKIARQLNDQLVTEMRGLLPMMSAEYKMHPDTLRRRRTFRELREAGGE